MCEKKTCKSIYIKKFAEKWKTKISISILKIYKKSHSSLEWLKYVYDKLKIF